MTVPVNRVLAPLCAPLLAVGVLACGTSTSTAGLKGEEHEVAQTISNLQSDATARNERKICTSDLASSVVKGLEGAKGGCTQAMKNQLAEVDSFELTVQSVKMNTAHKPPTAATAHVRGVFKGKTRPATVSLVKEAGRWKISSFSEL